MRRFCRGNRLHFLWTLTYAVEPGGRAQVVADVRRFFERLQTWFGRLPLVAVIERGGKNGRLHVHFGAHRFLGIEAVRRAWGHGIVHVGDPRGLPGRLTVRELAGYLAKYVSKRVITADGEILDDREPGGHRYLITQGWSPRCWRFRLRSFGQADQLLRQLVGRPAEQLEFGAPGEDVVWGVWATYPEACWHPPPGAGRGPPAGA